MPLMDNNNVDEKIDTDDDNIPLSELIKRKRKIAEPESKESDSDDDVPISELLKRKAVKRNVAAPANGISSNKRPKSSDVSSAAASKPSNKGGDVKSMKGSKKSENSNKNGKSSKKISVNTVRSQSVGKAGLSKSSEFYAETKKGFLVQRLLVRWWYAIKWPNLEDIGQPPIGYESLDGFPGVFVCTNVC